MGIDGFRIDTVKHVNMEFWQKFSPAVLKAARDSGSEDFFMFGEVFDADPRLMSPYSTKGALQATLDFGFQANATAFAQGKPTAQLRDFFAQDDYYTDTDSNAYQLPTFLGNHDMGRIGTFLNLPGASDTELLARDKLAHSLMYLTRGQPVVYYGDEQGFTGAGGDKDARQDMFATQTADYTDDEVVDGAGGTIGSRDRYDPNAPMYKHIAAMQRLRAPAPRARRRHPDPPVLLQQRRPVRRQPARQGPDRVPRGRQQQHRRRRRRTWRRTCRRARFKPLWRRRRLAPDRPRGPGDGHRARPVGRRLPRDRARSSTAGLRRRSTCTRPRRVGPSAPAPRSPRRSPRTRR